MRKIRKLLITVLTILLILAIALSTFYMIRVGGCHDCDGACCVICMRVRLCTQLLCGWFLAALAWGRFISVKSSSAKLPAPELMLSEKFSLISNKILLLN